jgi:hypothetical protein
VLTMVSGRIATTMILPKVLIQAELLISSEGDVVLKSQE